jgi:hypothetical protein
VSERTAHDIRAEIAAEREHLNEDLAQLQSALRSLALFVVAGVVVIRLLTWRRVWRTFR